jgi:hypothetical protein
MHIPIGIANTVDSLKTFVEAEGNFSPGFGSYGIYFWVWDDSARKLYAPTMDGVKCEHGLGERCTLIPWAKWHAGGVEVKTEVCQVKRRMPVGPILVDNTVPFRMHSDAFLVGARVHLSNQGKRNARLSLYTALRPLGPSGGPVKEIAADRSSLQVEKKVVLHACGSRPFFGESAPQAGVLATDTVADWARRGELPARHQATSETGDCSGAFKFDFDLPPGETRTFGFICPVLPGRYALGHKWDGVSTWAQFDLNPAHAAEGDVSQPVLDPQEWGKITVDDLFNEATAYWSRLQQRVRLQLPDRRWAESFAAIVGHAALCLNEGAPDVAVVNYNVFNRDGMYMANIFQKSGNFDLAEQAIDYFLRHPFNGRVQPEADNPGQILWVMGEHWRFTRKRDWLKRVYPAAQKLAAMIHYYRTTPGPHWVWDTSLDFGDALPKNQRKALKPGACDGFNPNYTEAYDIAGLRGALTLAEEIGNQEDASAWRKLADDLFALYERKFSLDLPKGYGSYSVLWPCRLYPFGEGRAFEQFRGVGAQKPTDWRYFPLARAHQGLLAGNRAAGHETLNIHLAHPQMQGWYAFDEGGPSGVGGWYHVRTTWPVERNKDGSPKSTRAMPHGWAIAEYHLLLRDSLLFEDGDKLVLLSGVPPDWFKHPGGMKVEKMPTHFGLCSFDYTPKAGGAMLKLNSAAPGGCVLRVPLELKARVAADNQVLSAQPNGDFLLPPGTRQARLDFTDAP